MFIFIFWSISLFFFFFFLCVLTLITFNYSRPCDACQNAYMLTARSKGTLKSVNCMLCKVPVGRLTCYWSGILYIVHFWIHLQCMGIFIIQYSIWIFAFCIWIMILRMVILSLFNEAVTWLITYSMVIIKIPPHCSSENNYMHCTCPYTHWISPLITILLSPVCTDPVAPGTWTPLQHFPISLGNPIQFINPTNFAHATLVLESVPCQKWDLIFKKYWIPGCALVLRV